MPVQLAGQVIWPVRSQLAPESVVRQTSALGAEPVEFVAIRISAWSRSAYTNQAGPFGAAFTIVDDRQVDPPSAVRYATIQPPLVTSSAQMFDASMTMFMANRARSGGLIQCSPWSLETNSPIPDVDAHHVPDRETPAPSIEMAFPAGPIATVYVRYRIPGTQDVRERSWTVEGDGAVPALDQSSVAMRLAATASAFSEWLAASPFAQEVTPDELLKDLSGVPQVFGADQRPQQLEWMIRQAKSLSGK